MPRKDKTSQALHVPYRFISQSAGKGWLCVPLRTLETLGIAGDITGFSCMATVPNGSGQQETWVGLEPVLDAQTFITAFQRHFGRKPNIVNESHPATPLAHYPAYRYTKREVQYV